MTRANIIDHISAETFSKKFTIALDKWCKENGKEQKDFQKEVGVSSKNTITNWKKGMMPKKPEVFQKVCQVLQVPEYYFLDRDHKLLYENSDYMTDFVGPELKAYMHKIGLKQSFIRSIKDLSDMGSSFPVWTPFRLNENVDIFSDEKPKYERSEASLADSGRMKAMEDPVYKSFQIKRDGKTITLSKMDLLFLKDVQDAVQGCIQRKFVERSHQMAEETREANKHIKKITPKEGGALTVIDREAVNKCDTYLMRAIQKEGDPS